MQKSKINCNLRFKARLVELLFCCKIKGSLKCFVDVMYSEFRRKVFYSMFLSIKVLLPYNDKCVNTSSIMDRRFGLKIITFCRRDCLSFLKFKQGRK